MVAIARAGQAFLPEKNCILEEGDVLYISATCDGIEKLREKLTKAGEK